MAKSGRLDLKIDGNSKKRLMAKASYLKMNLTNFLEKVADDHIVFLDDKVTKILKSYGYNLNTMVPIESDGECRNINSDDNKDREIRVENKTGGNQK